MAKRTSGITKGLEEWNVRGTGNARLNVLKIVVRYPDGKFHGATNFRADPKRTSAR